MLEASELQRLATEIEHPRGPMVVRADSPAEQEEIVAWLLAARPETALVDTGSAPDPIGLVVEEARRATVIVATGPKEADTEWLQRLNVGRDALRAAEDTAIVFVLDGPRIDALAQSAPDFWSWRGGVYGDGAATGCELESATKAVEAGLDVARLETRWGLSPAATSGPAEPALNLRDGYRALIARPGAESAAFYVDLGDEGWGPQVRRGRAGVELAGAGDRLLVAGPAGVGLTTFMWACGRELVARRISLPMPVHIGLFEQRHEEVCARIGGAAHDELIALGLRSVAEPFGDWASELLRSWGREPAGESLASDLACIPVTWIQQFPVAERTYELLDRAGRAAQEAGFGTGLTLLIDGMESSDLGSLDSIVSVMLERLPCPSVMAVPIALALEARGEARAIERLPLLLRPIQPRLTLPGSLPGAPGPDRLLCRRLLSRRLSPDLLTEAALDLLCQSAGILPGTLFRLVRGAVLSALAEDAEQIDEPHVADAVSSEVGRIRASLSAEVLKKLDPFFTDRRYVQGEGLEALVAQGWLLPDESYAHLRRHPLVTRAMK